MSYAFLFRPRPLCADKAHGVWRRNIPIDTFQGYQWQGHLSVLRIQLLPGMMDEYGRIKLANKLLNSKTNAQLALLSIFYLLRDIDGQIEGFCLQEYIFQVF